MATDEDDGADLGSVNPDDVEGADPAIEDLVLELADLKESVDSPAERAQVEETMALAMRVSGRGTFGRVIRGFDRADLAEALLGSVVFGIPMFVESGTLEIGAFLAAHPPLFGLTVVVAIGLVVNILYVAEFQDVRVYRPLFGFLPRRIVGVVGVSALTAVTLMTAWGRVDWADPWLSVCTVAVAFFPMVVGAALGDILPGS
jgi:uncharacterized membrane protein